MTPRQWITTILVVAAVHLIIIVPLVVAFSRRAVPVIETFMPHALPPPPDFGSETITTTDPATGQTATEHQFTVRTATVDPDTLADIERELERQKQQQEKKPDPEP